MPAEAGIVLAAMAAPRREGAAPPADTRRRGGIMVLDGDSGRT